MTIYNNHNNYSVLIRSVLLLFSSILSGIGISAIQKPDPLILSLRNQPNSFLVLSDGEIPRVLAPPSYDAFEKSTSSENGVPTNGEIRHEILGPSAHWRIVLGDLCQLPEIRRPAGDTRRFAECEPLEKMIGNGRISRTDLGVWKLRECPPNTEFVMLLQVCLPRESALRLHQQLCETPDPSEQFAFCSPENAKANMWLPIQRTVTDGSCRGTVPLTSSSYYASIYSQAKSNNVNCPAQEVIEPCKVPLLYGEEFTRMRSFPSTTIGQNSVNLPPCPCPPVRTSCICVEAQRPLLFLDCCCEEKQAPPCLCTTMSNQQPNLQNLGQASQQPSQFVGQPQLPQQPQPYSPQNLGTGQFGPSDSATFPQQQTQFPQQPQQPFSGSGYPNNLGQPLTSPGGYGQGQGIGRQPSGLIQQIPYGGPGTLGDYGHRPLPSSSSVPFSGGPNRPSGGGFYPQGSFSVADESAASVIQPQPCPLIQADEIQRAKYQGICSWMLDPLANDPESRTHFLQCQPAPYNVLCGRWQRMPCSPSTVFDAMEQLCVWDLAGAQPGPLPPPGFGQPIGGRGGGIPGYGPMPTGTGGWQTVVQPIGPGPGQIWPSSSGLGTGGPIDNIGTGPNVRPNIMPNIGGPNVGQNIGTNILPNAGPNILPNIIGQNLGPIEGGIVGGPQVQGQGFPSGPTGIAIPNTNIDAGGASLPNIGGAIGTGTGGRKILECTCRTGGIALGNCDSNLLCPTPQAVCHVGLLTPQIPCNVCCFYRSKRRR